MMEEFCIQDIETLKALADPLRVSIIRSLYHVPRTAKEIASVVGRDVTTLYYHLRMLERHKLIEVVETHLVSGIAENTYRAASKHFRIDEQLLTGAASEEIEVFLGFLFDGTRSEVRRALQAGLIHADSDDSILDRFVARLTPQEYQRFGDRLRAVLHEITTASEAHREDDPATRQYGLTATFYAFPEEPDHE